MAEYEARLTLTANREHVVRIWPQVQRHFRVDRIRMRQQASTFEIRDILVGLSSQMPEPGARLYASTFSEGLRLRLDVLPPGNALTFRVRNIGPRTGRLHIIVQGTERDDALAIASGTVVVYSPRPELSTLRQHMWIEIKDSRRAYGASVAIFKSWDPHRDGRAWVYRWRRVKRQLTERAVLAWPVRRLAIAELVGWPHFVPGDVVKEFVGDEDPDPETSETTALGL